MLDGRSQGRQLKRTHAVSFSETKEDLSGPQFSRAGARKALREFKRVDRVNPNMMLNGMLLDLYHEDLLGGGTWSAETKKRMEEKYSIPQGQYE